MHVPAGTLVVPLCDSDGGLHSLEFIWGSEKKKRFLPSGQTGGHFLVLGNPDASKEICIAEGYATSATIYEVTVFATFVAFDCGNLESVARSTRKKFPEAKIILCADDDHLTKSNPGVSHATAAAKPIGARVALPDFGEGRLNVTTDHNDLARLKGAPEVKAQIEAVLASPCAIDAEQVSPGDGYHRTDMGHAARLRDHVAGRCYYVPEWKKWIFWSGKVWRTDIGGGRMLREAGEIPRKIYAEAAQEPDKDRRKLKVEEAASLESFRAQNAMIGLLRGQPGMETPATTLDKNHSLLYFENGTRDDLTGQFRSHDPRDFITRILSYSYDPDARCPTWLRVVAEIWPDPETAAFVQRFAGYCMTGSTKEQVLLFLYGHGANGKTLFAKVLQLLLGEYSCQCTLSLLIETKQKEHTTEQADLLGKYLAVCAETPAGMYWNEVLLKNATGGDRMKARRLYEDNQEWDATHKFLILGNNKPRVRGQDCATWRRMILVHCDQTFPRASEIPTCSKSCNVSCRASQTGHSKARAYGFVMDFGRRPR